jgi:hypothetical protein
VLWSSFAVLLMGKRRYGLPVSFCTNCGAPIQKLEAGRCPFCKTILNEAQAGGLVIDGRGPIWRVVLIAAGPKPKKTAKTLVDACQWRADQAEAFVASLAGGPRVVVENLPGGEATKIFIALQASGAEVSLERRQGADYVVTNSSQIIRDFAAKRGRR